jgi:hypothetical protein
LTEVRDDHPAALPVGHRPALGVDDAKGVDVLVEVMAAMVVALEADVEGLDGAVRAQDVDPDVLHDRAAHGVRDAVAAVEDHLGQVRCPSALAEVPEQRLDDGRALQAARVASGSFSPPAARRPLSRSGCR